jgi:FkbM family methyltransferase
MQLKEYTKTRYHDNFGYFYNDHIIGGSLRCYGEYAEFEVSFLLEVIRALNKPNVVVYDVGANIGYHTTAFASTGADVYAFEPNPLTYQLLEENTKQFDNVWLAECAVGAEQGSILVEDFDPAKITNYGSVKVGADSGTEVPLIALDMQDLPAPDLIKIDVEGFEYAVLAGAVNIINRAQPVLYYEAQESGADLSKIYNLLDKFGYKMYWSIVMNYNPGNFKNESKNVFENTAITSVLALPSTWPELPNLHKVLGPDDHFRKFFANADEL